MSNHIPLNGTRPLAKVHRALSGPAAPSAADVLRAGFGDQDEDAPDGTGGSTKSFPNAANEDWNVPIRATDRSQGLGNTRPSTEDPLLKALRGLPSVRGVF